MPVQLQILLALPSLLAQESATPFSAALEADLERLVPTSLAEHGEPGLALVLVEGGAVTACRGFGWADREAERRVDPDTLFNVGSLSKTVTAWGVMDLVESSDLALDAAVLPLLERWSLPPSEYDAGGVTVQRLLRHTAGLSMPSIGGRDLDEELPTLEEELAEHVRLIAAPGTRHLYSGGGYLVLQLLVEEVAAAPFAEVLRTSVLEPLGMHSSRFGYDPALAERTATPYSVRVDPNGAASDGASGHTPWRQRAFVGAAGAGLYTSARDLGRFLAAHCEGPAGEPPGRGVLRPQTLRTMWTANPTAPRQGLGYEVPPPPGDHVLVMHGGTNFGWRAHFFVAPDLGLAIGVLTNSDGDQTLRAVLGAFRDALLAHIAHIAPEAER